MNQEPDNQSEIQIPKSEASNRNSEFGNGKNDPTMEEMGELDVWLCQHPLESAKLEDLQDLVRLCRQCDPPEPSHQAWSNLLAGVKASLTAPTQVARPERPEVRLATSKWTNLGQRLLRNSFWGAAAAAAIVLAVFLRHGSITKVDQSGASKSNVMQELAKSETHEHPNLVDLGNDVPIANTDDFALVSMKASDAELLLVGQPLVTEPLVLVGMNDVDLISVEPDDDDDYVPIVRMKSASPMIISKIRSEDTKQPGE